MAAEVIEQVKQTMVACSQQCLNAMRKEGIKVLALLSQDLDAIDKIKCSVQTARWRSILEARLPPSHCAARSCRLAPQQRRLGVASQRLMGVLTTLCCRETPWSRC